MRHPLPWLALAAAAIGLAAFPFTGSLENRLLDAFVYAKFDLGDMGGYGYYSGTRFAIYGAAANDALARGGRYDEVGAIFGRNRPAVGFSLDLKALAEVAAMEPAAGAIRAPGTGDAGLRGTVRELRAGGEIVVQQLSGDRGEEAGFVFDRELVEVNGRWALRALEGVVGRSNAAATEHSR